MSNTNLDSAILVYDINTVPYGVSIDQVLRMFEEHKIVLYDGNTIRSNPQCVPTIYTMNREIVFKIIDTKALSPKDIKDLIGNIQQTYEINQEEEFPDFCDMDGRAVSKYVYFVRKILFVKAPMSGEWMKEFEEAKNKIKFPMLTENQIYDLRMEEANKNIQK